jgi:hypothetical protein
MDRRSFLQSLGALALWQPVSSSRRTSVIKTFDDGYEIDVGPLRCLTEKDGSGTILTFGVFLTSYPMPGVVDETRMAPTEMLKQRLEAVGFPVAWEIWNPDYPFIVARIDPCPLPQEIAARLQGVLAGCNPEFLYQNSSSGR